jgi:dimethylamine monooxygenase subunit A
VTLGFSVETLLPHARVSGPLRMGLVRLADTEWLDPAPDLAARKAAFDAHADSVQVLPEGNAPARELAEMLGAADLESAARSHWEDFCLLTQDAPGAPYRLTAAAVAFPTDWRLAEKMGKPLHAVHAPIHGYAEQLSDGVDRFMERLRTGEIYGRTNAFVMPSADLRYMPTVAPERRYDHVTPDNAGSSLFVRCERETLRRLPRTGAIVFTIGVYRTALASLSDAAMARIASSVGAMLDGEEARRGAPAYAEALTTYAAARSRACAA